MKTANEVAAEFRLMPSQRPRAFEPWGQFVGGGELQDLITKGLKDPRQFRPKFEQWVPPTELPPMLQDAWGPYHFDRVGLWPLISRERIVGMMVAARSASDRSTSDACTSLILDACATQLSMALDLRRAIRRAEIASQRDWLTGLWNRRGLHHRLPDLLDVARAQGLAVIVGVVDLDYFKVLNDSQGHPAGDDALRRVADILARAVRADNIVARWGGDEFVVVLSTPEASAEDAMAQLQSAVMHEAPDFSISVGWAIWGVDGDSWIRCYAAADSRLYQAKRRRHTFG